MSTLATREWQTLAEPLNVARAPRGLDAAWAWTVGQAPRLRPRRRAFARRAARIHAMAEEIGREPDAAFAERVARVRAAVRRGAASAAVVDEGIAVAGVGALRAMGLRPHREQFMGAVALSEGCVAEMATGEGKTLTAALAAIVAGWRGRGVHVITVNDYLAQRDAEWMAGLYALCGVSVGYVTGATNEAERRAAYARDVTHTTNKEVAADFLRDRLRLGARAGGGALAHTLSERIASGGGGASAAAQLTQRGLACAIVDEADSVLIDEAVTPLIISGAEGGPERREAFLRAAAVARELAPGTHYSVDRARREVRLTDAGRAQVAMHGEGDAWGGRRRREELVAQALVAREHYHLGKHYVIQEGRVVIVDEFTGRLMPDRTWRDGLHQAVEAKEAIAIRESQGTLARVSFQRFFRLYRQLSGMTGTAREAAGELWRVYRLPVVAVPTHRPVARRQEPERIFARESEKFEAIVREVGRLRDEGRPALIGARSVAASERLSELLAREGTAHTVLNAVRHTEEAQIVARAGERGAVTVATNMAGRGTDIRLGDGVAEVGGLAVIASERHESRRVDRQLFGRAGRQGDPGSAQALVSLEDELVTRHARRAAALLRRVARGELRGLRRLAALGVFRLAERRATAAARRMRAGVLRADDWLDDSLGFAGKRL